MIKALLLVLNPAASWDRIVQSKRGWPVILFVYVLPLLLLGGVAEWYGLVHWGKSRGEISTVHKFLASEAFVFEIFQLLLLNVVVFIGAKLIKALGETFRGRNTFGQAFTVAAYGLSPVFAMHVLDMFPWVSNWAYWAVWGVGMFCCFSVLYHGIPKVMLPDPPHAFGLYLTSGLMLALTSGLVRFLTYLYLAGKIGKLDNVISNIAASLPFLQSLDLHHF